MGQREERPAVACEVKNIKQMLLADAPLLLSEELLTHTITLRFFFINECSQTPPGFKTLVCQGEFLSDFNGNYFYSVLSFVWLH